MNRVSLSVTSVGLVVLLALMFPGHVENGPADGRAPVGGPTSGSTSCPNPSFGPGETDAQLLCIAASHQQP